MGCDFHKPNGTLVQLSWAGRLIRFGWSCIGTPPLQIGMTFVTEIGVSVLAARVQAARRS
jgi:hypothetical protein